MSGNLAPQTYDKSVAAVRNVGFDFTNDLPAADILSGTPTVVSDLTGLVVGTPTVNVATVVIAGRTVAIGKAVVVSVSVGTLGFNYLLTATCGTTGSETVDGTARLRIRE